MARQALIAILVAGAYYTSGYFGIAAKVPPAGISALFPPSAVILAALLVTPRRFWWMYLVTVLPTHVYLFLRCLPDMPNATLAFQALGYTLQAYLGAELVRRFDRLPPRLDDLRSVTLFLLLGALITPMLASTTVVYLYTLTGWVGEYWLIWRQRLLANVIPTLTLTPLIVLLFNSGLPNLRRIAPRRLLEFVVLLLAMAGGAFLALGWMPAEQHSVPALLFVLLPLLLWAAVRFQPAVLFSCLLAITLGSLYNAYHQRGPFLTLAQEENVMALQFFVIAISVPLILFTGLIQERRRTEQALRVSEQRYSLATAAGSAGVWDWNLVTGELYMDPSLKAMLGYHDHEVENTMEGWIRCMHPDDVTGVRTITESHLKGAIPYVEVEHRALHRDGSMRWLLCRGVVVEKAGGTPARMMGTDTDITERKLAERELQRSSEQIRELAGKLITAQEEERRRIARELHDDLNQKVAALSIEISSLRINLASDASDLTGKLEALQARTSGLVKDIRELSHDIHPATLEHAGLIPALTSMAAQLKRLEDVDVELALPDQPTETPHQVAICLYRVAQESVRNVVRHAGTKQVAIELHANDTAVTLEVRDRGRGFDVDRARSNGGLGLISIQERVRLLNGSARVISRPGRGTTLRVELPLHAGHSPNARAPEVAVNG